MSLLVNLTITIFLSLSLIQEVQSFTTYRPCQPEYFQVQKASFDNSINWDEFGYLNVLPSSFRAQVNNLLTSSLQNLLSHSIIGNVNQYLHLNRQTTLDQPHWLYLDHHSLLI